MAHRIYKSTPDGKVTLFKDSAAGVTALAYGADNRLYAAEPTLRRIVSYAVEGGTASDEQIIVRNVAAHSLAITAKGVLYCTDQERRSVDLIDAAGHARAVYTGGEIAVPEGIALSSDQAMVIVSDAQSRFSWSFQIAADGALVNGEPFFRLEMPETGWQSRTGGIAEDATGQSYFATPLGIQVCEASGRMIEILNAPIPGSAVTSVAFAGANPAWIYATEGNSLYRRPVKITPAVVWAPAKPPKPLL